MTAVGVWVVAINFAYCDTLEASYGLFWRHPAISGTQTHATALLFSMHRATTSRRCIRIRWQVPNEKPNLSAISEKVLRQSTRNTANYQHVYDYAPCRGMAETLTIFNLSRHTLESRKPLKSLSSLHGTITENCSEHFMRFHCSFPEYGNKSNANPLKHTKPVQKLRRGLWLQNS
jgi:hypothetical protein